MRAEERSEEFAPSLPQHNLCDLSASSRAPRHDDGRARPNHWQPILRRGVAAFPSGRRPKPNGRAIPRRPEPRTKHPPGQGQPGRLPLEVAAGYICLRLPQVVVEAEAERLHEPRNRPA